MKKFLRIFLYCLLSIYFFIVLFISFLVINENKFGISEIGNKYWVMINESNNNYNSGDLVIVKKKNINELNADDEVFLYESSVNNEVNIKTGNINEINTGVEPNYLKVNNSNGYYRVESILGVKDKKINTLGGIISFFEKRWIFLLVLIVPSIALLLVELYMLIKSLIKYKKSEDKDFNLDN